MLTNVAGSEAGVRKHVISVGTTVVVATLQASGGYVLRLRSSQGPVERGGADVEAVGDSGDGALRICLPGVSRHRYLVGCEGGWSAADATSCSSGRQARVRALADQVALELGERRGKTWNTGG